MLIQEAIDYLGYEATDRITGFTGVLTAVQFDLPGCIMVVISPKVKESEPHKIPDVDCLILIVFLKVMFV